MQFIVTVKDEDVINKLQQAPALFRKALADTVNILATDIQASVIQNKLSGQVLHVRTGTLRRSITIDPAKWDGSKISASVFTTLDYGIGWENGFSRRVGAGARGGPRTLRGKALVKYFERHPPNVREYAARPFLKPTLEEFKPRIIEDLRQAIVGALHGT